MINYSLLQSRRALFIAFFPLLLAVSAHGKNIDFAKEVSKHYGRRITQLPQSYGELAGLIPSPKMKDAVRNQCTQFVSQIFDLVPTYDYALFLAPIGQEIDGPEIIFDQIQNVIKSAYLLSPSCYNWVSKSYILSSAFLLAQTKPEGPESKYVAKNARLAMTVAYLMNKNEFEVAPFKSEFKEGNRAYLDCGLKKSFFNVQQRPFDLAATTMEQIDQYGRLRGAYLEHYGSQAGKLLDKTSYLQLAPFRMGPGAFQGANGTGADWVESFLAESIGASSVGSMTQWYALYNRSLSDSLNRLSRTGSRDFSFIDGNGPINELLSGSILKEIAKNDLLHSALFYNLRYVAPKDNLIRALLAEPPDSHVGYYLGELKDRKSLRRRLQRLLLSENADRPAYSGSMFYISMRITVPSGRRVDLDISSTVEETATLVEELINKFKVSRDIESELTPIFISEFLMPVAKARKYALDFERYPLSHLLCLSLEVNCLAEQTLFNKEIPKALDQARSQFALRTLENYAQSRSPKTEEILKGNPRLGLYVRSSFDYSIGETSLRTLYYWIQPSKYTKNYSFTPYCLGLNHAVNSGQLKEFNLPMSGGAVIRPYSQFKRGL